jgi:predicted metal-dependent phosphotriesterase family hydrolase
MKMNYRFICKDVEEGIDEYDYGLPVCKTYAHKAGLIKLATGDEPISAHQEKIFHAVVNTHRHTGRAHTYTYKQRQTCHRPGQSFLQAWSRSAARGFITCG